MSNSTIPIPALDFHMGKLERARLNVANAEFSVLTDGKLLPVAIMYGMDGRIVRNPLHAFQCVVFANGGLQMAACVPGDIAPIRRK
jgi:hypothetical protein